MVDNCHAFVMNQMNLSKYTLKIKSKVGQVKKEPIQKHSALARILKSGRVDLNHRPPAPEAGALT